MLKTVWKKSDTEEIVQDNLDYTLFSWSKQKGISPIAVKRAEGVYLYDYDDKRYLDFSSGLMNVNIGHGNQRVTTAVAQQMQEVSYVTPSCVTRARGELGKKTGFHHAKRTEQNPVHHWWGRGHRKCHQAGKAVYRPP